MTSRRRSKKQEETQMSFLIKKLAEANAERQRGYHENWEAKIKAADKREECKRCCNKNLYFSPPIGATNMWLQIQHEKSQQTAALTLQDVPLRTLKPPPLPDITLADLSLMSKEEKTKFFGDLASSEDLEMIENFLDPSGEKKKEKKGQK